MVDTLIPWDEMELSVVDPGVCRIYFLADTRLYCIQESVGNTFAFFPCSRGGEPINSIELTSRTASAIKSAIMEVIPDINRVPVPDSIVKKAMDWLDDLIAKNL